MLLDIAPGSEPVAQELYLTSGRPLVRWSCRGGLEEAKRWLDEGRDRNAFIDLEISLNEAMSLSDIQSLRKAHDGIVHIRPVYPGRESREEAAASRSQMPVHELFRRFYQQQSGGAEPEEELVDLFMSLVAEEEEEKGEVE
ncbi:hypothetical protein D3C74_356050 [compost metagenome]